MLMTVTSHDGQLIRFTSSTVSLHTEQPALKISTFLVAMIHHLQRLIATAGWATGWLRLGSAPNKRAKYCSCTQPRHGIRTEHELPEHDDQRGEQPYQYRNVTAVPLPAEEHE